MARNKIIETSVQALVTDNLNFNKGTQYGQHLIEESLRKFGVGRSILIDRNNRIIAGNKTFENAGALGMEDVLIVETTGNQIVAVKRLDIDLDTPHGREMALADNATGKANLEWDERAIKMAVETFGIEPEAWGVDLSLDEAEEEGQKEEEQTESSARLIVQGNVAILSMLFSELQNRGFTVELKE